MRIIITDKVHPILITELEADGHTISYDTTITMNNLDAYLPDADGIIINSKITMDRAMIDLGTKLKFIGRLGSGMEIIDVDYANSRGVKCINTPDGNCDAVAEHAIGMLLALNNNLIRSHQQMQTLNWQREQNRGIELMHKTIGIIGVGHTGSALARKLKGFDMHILGYDKYRTVYSEDLNHVKRVDLNELIAHSDIISLHLPLSEETKYLANADFFETCKTGVTIINTSRGNIVDLKALLNGVKSGKIGGACLDVFENEKTATYSTDEVALYSALGSYDNIMLSPHIAGWTHESLQRIATLMLGRIRDLLAGA